MTTLGLPFDGHLMGLPLKVEVGWRLGRRLRYRDGPSVVEAAAEAEGARGSS